LTEAEYYETYLGYNDERAFREIADARGRRWDNRTIAELTERKAAITEALERDESTLFPGARAVIERLAAVCTLAIASGALRSEIQRALQHGQLGRFFAIIVSADDGGASKPSPDPYLLAVERLSVSTGEPLTGADCVAVEDSPWGLQSARAAGMRTVAVTHTYAADALTSADLVVDRLEALTWETLCSLPAPRPPTNS
jgi:beta-phosphoglucomutase